MRTAQTILHLAALLLALAASGCGGENVPTSGPATLYCNCTPLDASGKPVSSAQKTEAGCFDVNSDYATKAETAAEARCKSDASGAASCSCEACGTYAESTAC